MAMSKCIKCEHTQFELKVHTPAGSKYQFNFVQCSSCGGVAGVVDFLNTGHQLVAIEDVLGKLQKQLQKYGGGGNVNIQVDAIAQAVKRIEAKLSKI